jgi:hypothetical protein
MEDNKQKKKYEVSKETRRKYTENFLSSNKDKLKERHTCEVCGGHYKYYGKSHHNATEKHKKALNNNITKKVDEISDGILLFNQLQLSKQLLEIIIKSIDESDLTPTEKIQLKINSTKSVLESLETIKP